MKMPISEVVDRYTITLIRSTMTNLDVSNELESYKEEIEKENVDKEKIELLYYYNKKIWDLESETSRDTKKIQYSDDDYIDIGKKSIVIRNYNYERNKVKQALSEDGAKNGDLLVTYCKVDYGSDV